MAHGPLTVALVRLDRWCREGDALPEKALETLLLLDVFRDGLGYSTRDAVAQVGADHHRTGVTDLLLKINQRDRAKWIVVEIKRPGRTLNDSAVRQAGRYLVSLGACRGIVTTGQAWVFVRTRLKPGAKWQYLVEPLLRIEATTGKVRHRTLREATLRRCAKATIWNFFRMLDALRDLGADGINAAIAPVSQRQWPGRLRRAMRKVTGRPGGSKDLGVLRIACQDMATLVRCVLEVYQRESVTATRSARGNLEIARTFTTEGAWTSRVNSR
jgi:hypothetical protein